MSRNFNERLSDGFRMLEDDNEDYSDDNVDLTTLYPPDEESDFITHPIAATKLCDIAYICRKKNRR